ASQAIGYKEILDHLEGETPLDDAFDLVVRRTRRFARRQRVWFARDPRITWLDAGAAKTDVVAETVLATWSAPIPSGREADRRPEPQAPIREGAGGKRVASSP
ncbi:MAG TPA: hypothetical protein VFX21_12245, partial [Acidimicrobiia bacterium]|nr:hypothetical protein [Acidimicrobiia bacterium]